MDPLLAGLLAGLAVLLAFWAFGTFNSVTLGCDEGSPVVEQVIVNGDRHDPASYTKVTCPDDDR